MVEDFWADVKYGMRGLRKNLGFTVVALLTIAIGIGANAAVFSVVDAVMLRPLRYPNSQELMALKQNAPGAGGLNDVCRWVAAVGFDVFHLFGAEPIVSGDGSVVAGQRECHGCGRARAGEDDWCLRWRVGGVECGAGGGSMAFTRGPSTEWAGARDVELRLLAAEVRRRPHGGGKKYFGGFAAKGNRGSDAAGISNRG